LLNFTLSKPKDLASYLVLSLGNLLYLIIFSNLYNEIRQLKTKKYYPNRQYGQIPNTPEFIIRPPLPTPQNTQDIAKRYILLQPNTVINDSNLNSYLAQIVQGTVSNVVVQGGYFSDFSLMFFVF
jgi:hypothetical protein